MEAKVLKGYQNTKEETFKKGCNVSIDGELYNILDFKDEDVNLDHIATALSRIQRYVGHTPLSVAQHSYIMAMSFIMMGDVHKAFQAWGHDTSEAYLGDMAAPLKRILKEHFNPIEEAIEKVIADHFGYKYPYDPDVIDIVDKNASQMEMVLMRHANIFDDDYYWDEHIAKKRYLEMYDLIRKLLEYDRKELVFVAGKKPAG